MISGHTAPIVSTPLGFLVNQKEEPGRVILLLFSLEQILRLKRCGRVTGNKTYRLRMPQSMRQGR